MQAGTALLVSLSKQLSDSLVGLALLIRQEQVMCGPPRSWHQ